MPSAIAFQHVSFAHRTGAHVLSDVSLDVAAGEIVSLVGRSGSGKTTMLRLINRLAVPSGGRVLVDGRDTRDWDAIRLRRSIGYVIQEGGLFPHMTVADNIAVVPRLERWDEARIRGRVRELLALVGLSEGEGQRWPAELSGGERQRVGLARALAADPGVLLMDEPFGALDPVTRLELHGELRRIQHRVRKTIVLVTHDMGEALALGDRVAVLAGGTIAASAPPRELARSDDPHVRQLLDAVTEPLRRTES